MLGSLSGDRKTRKEADREMLGGLMTLRSLKNSPLLHKHILWDVEPKQLMEPTVGKSGSKLAGGYIFYIDKMGSKKPALYVMCQTGSGYAETIGKIDEVPEDLLIEAVHENKHREYFKMSPINKKLEEWLKTELGIKE